MNKCLAPGWRKNYLCCANKSCACGKPHQAYLYFSLITLDFYKNLLNHKDFPQITATNIHNSLGGLSAKTHFCSFCKYTLHGSLGNFNGFYSVFNYMVCAKMSNVKKQRVLTNFIVSDEGESSSESRELLTSISESDNVVDVHYLRKFLPC